MVTLLFNDEIFGEIVDLFDRLILIDDDTEIQCSLVEIISSLFQTFVQCHQDNLECGFDKLFELIRISMLPLFRILPFYVQITMPITKLINCYLNMLEMQRIY